MKDLLYYSLDRIKAGNFFLIYPLFLLQLKLFFKIGFEPKNPAQKEIDIVIPTISKDFSLLDNVISSLKNLKQTVNKIFIVSQENDEIISFCKKNNLVFIEEKSLLGYGKEKIDYQVNKIDRSGWIFQQLLKLSGDKIVEKEDYLVLDSDTVLTATNSFVDNNRFVFYQNKEWHQPYFESFKKIFGYTTKNKLSFTSHMMIFNKKLLSEMKQEMEKRWGKSWDQVYLMTINNKEASCVSDYDTYANWVLYHHPNLVTEQPFYNKSLSRKKLDSLSTLEKNYGKRYKSVSFHSYIK